MIIVSSKNQINKYTTIREGETKLGQVIPYIQSDMLDLESLKLALSFSEQKNIILGIPEDIGVRANFGKPGARKAYDTFLSYFVNMQANLYTEDYSAMILGEVYVADLLEMSDKTDDIQELRRLTSLVDERVFPIIAMIVEAGKTPIVIGGGHNNSFGIIKGVSRGLEKKITVLNIDPHADFRVEEGRHSGNGFRYAYNQNFIENYYIYGLHSNYNNSTIINEFEKNEDLDYIEFRDIIDREEFGFCEYLLEIDSEFGLEIDLDSIKNMPSSAMTSVGFSEETVLEFISDSKNISEVLYYHLAEGIASEGNEYKIGKFLSYAVSEILK